MPYRFKIDEPVEKGFRRIAREQLDTALAELATPGLPPKAVHECRKALKRLRALVRLADSSLKKGEGRRRVKSLSAIARLLSERRNQDVMLDTLAKLATTPGADNAFTLAPLRNHLAARATREAMPVDLDGVAKARSLLLREARKFARARLKKRGFAALAGGLETSYRKARKAIKDAYGEPSDDSFHAMRKAVQWHWRQMSLLARAWPDEFAVRVSAARDLSQMLGDDHDIAMLTVAATAADDLSYEHKDAIISLCQRRQRALRDAAEFRAARLFAETPKAFVRRMEAYWDCGRAIDPNFDAAPAQAPADPHRAQPLAPAAGTEPADDSKAVVQAKPRIATKVAAAAPSQRRA